MSDSGAELLPAPFLGVLRDLDAWLRRNPANAMIVGGVAASLLGRPRMTRDVDVLALVPEPDWPALLASASKFGLSPRLDAPLEFARRTHVLLMRHVASGIDIDVILGGLPFEHDMLRSSTLHEVGGVPLRLPAPEDLIVMKALAQRPQDWRDVEGLLDAFPQADLTRIRARLADFAAALTQRDFIDEFERLIERRSG